jgi:integrase
MHQEHQPLVLFVSVPEAARRLGIGKTLLREKIAAFHAAQEQGFAPVRSPSEHTVASWMREWLAGIKRRGKIRPSTYRRYEMDMRNHIIPAIGHIRLKELALDHVQTMADECYTRGKQPRKQGDKPGPLAPRTVRNILTPLSEALDVAKKRKLVRENVVLDVELPKAGTPDLYKLTHAEMRRFLDAARGDRLEALYWLAALGPREGELLGLRWRNVNLQAHAVKIVEAI